jgi:hypothetical protein
MSADKEIERLAKIDSREVYRDITEDTFTDSDEWAEHRNREWLNWVAENETPNRRKEK